MTSPRQTASAGAIRRVGRLGVASALLFFGTAGCVLSCEADTVPDPLTCTNAPSGAELTELGLATGPADPARVLVEGDPTYVVVDLEGRLLVSLRVLWQGPAAPACGQVEIHVRHPDTGVELDGESLQLLSSPTGNGRISAEVYFVADTWPANVDVELEAYGLSFTRRVQVGGFVIADAGVADAGQVMGDAEPVDSGVANGDAGPTDAGPPDAGPADAAFIDSGMGAADAG
ncbi:MAG: hypothetical protein AB8I08_22835 [Sandaracinaceae bacterium]